MEIRAVTERVGQIVTPILDSMGLCLVEVTYRSELGRWVLRVSVHRKGGVTLDELGMVNQDLSAALDVEDVLPARFNLEVSSAGLTRVLKEERDFVIFDGSFAQLTVREPNGGTRVLRGTLCGVEEGRVLILCGEMHEAVPLADVAKAKLDLDMKEKPSRENTKEKRPRERMKDKPSKEKKR
jgi:ribosome maturation factor RimP